MALIDLAIRQATRSSCRYRMGAVLAMGNRVLAAGPNVFRNAPSVDFRNATFHAEETVLRRARRTTGAVIYIARVDAAGRPTLAAPCPRCRTSLTAAGVVKALYTTATGDLGRLVLAGSTTPSVTHRV
ncbi:hypothetical protein K4749_12360 [Streptomyces sp. TRM72054]|uniref:hypothetical protein n=1 Tax=Streptomyces sp. TRM72054 TaxID=2870562 RepID=UPI001C8C2979|nr:hypothetical protein [Streptomyces sp. TRM72054]MBX9394373.1 hypothetical protein [Streptomyces sp. TRM72054]